MTIAALLAVAAPGGAAEPVAVHPESWVSFDDYPQEALRREEQGVVTVLLSVDENGRVRACAVTETSGSKALDEGTCALLTRRGRFQPARDAAGRAVAGDYRTLEAWGIGGPNPDATIELRVDVERLPEGYRRPARVEMLFDASGRASECRPRVSSGSAAADAIACRQAVAGVRVKPPRSASAAPAMAMRLVGVTFAAAGK